MRSAICLLALAAWSAACGKAKDVENGDRNAPDRAAAREDAPPPTTSHAPGEDGLPGVTTYADLGDALVATIPADARVIGFGELHSRTDRAKVRSALSSFTAALPRIADRISDLVVETWIVDPRCGQGAVQATKQLETAVKRPESTKSEIALLAEAARAAQIQPHAMTLSCDDYETLVPDGEIDPVAMLTLTTRELTRIATSAVTHRDKNRARGESATGDDAARRPWIAIYGGALHNDLAPDPGVAEWSYAAAIDAATGDKYVEIDLIVPELATADPVSQRQPWFPLAERATDRVQVVARSPRSFVVILPASATPR